MLIKTHPCNLLKQSIKYEDKKRKKKTGCKSLFSRCDFYFCPYKTNSMTVEDEAEPSITVALPVSLSVAPLLFLAALALMDTLLCVSMVSPHCPQPS